MKYLRNHWKWLLSLLFAVVVCCFWAIGEVHLLSFQEQYQLFLFTTDYFTERLSTPGGLADYIAEFITQWNYLFVVGAIALALLFTIFQRLTWLLLQGEGATDKWYLLSFIPPVLILAYMGDANVMLSYLVALIFAECLMLLWQRCLSKQKGSHTVITIITLLVMFPVCYWLIGPSVLIVAAYILIHEIENGGKPLNVVLGILTALYAIAVIYAIAQFRPEPMYRIFGGLNYYRFPAYIPWQQNALNVVVAIFPFLAKYLPKIKAKIAITVQAVVIIIGGGILVHFTYNSHANELIDYDYLVRMHAWDKIIAKAEKTPASTPLEVSCVNFALSQKGELCDRLFEFFQNGGEGLFPTFTRDMMSPVPTGEIFYSLGMVNDAERYFFEAQQAIPNFRRSGRLCKNIISCEIVNGQYAVARKLLHELQHTLFYSDWADSQLAILGNEEAINSDATYGMLRKYRVTKDYLFSDTEMDQMLGLLFSHCVQNKNAYEYLMAYELVQRDMQKFMTYYPIGRFAGYTDHIPYAIQQALLFHWVQTHNSFQGIPYSIDQRWGELMSQFMQTYMANQNDPSLSTPPLSNTFWSYMLVNKSKAQKTKNNSKEVY